jgi:asparagine synthase (glutamine-hydrolysing)
MDETLWAGIRNVPGGRRLVSVRRGTPRLHRYWDPETEKEQPITSLADAAEALRSAVTEAVRAHLRCIGTPEIELSGGWDSSTVALAAHELHAAGDGPDFQMSSVVFPDEPLIDETPYIEAMERHLGRSSLKRHHRAAPFDVLAQAFKETRHPWRRDDWRAIRASTTHRVTLTGDGGNETLGGMWRSGPAILADAFLTRRPRGPSARALLASVARPHLRPHLPRRVRVARSAPVGAWVDRDFSRRTSLMERIADAEPTQRSTTLRRIGLLSWLNSWGVQQDDLVGELDRGRFIELRHPLHDVRLVRLALRVPARVMGSPHTNARLLHDYAYGSALPSLVTSRTWGTEFTPLRVRELQRLVDGLGEPRRLRAAGWLDASRSAELIDRALLGTTDYWAASLLYAVELWMMTETHG